MKEYDEIFKVIEGYEGLYEVSNIGNIKSFHKDVRGILMMIQRDKKGYKRIVLTKEKLGTGFLVHRLVAKAFLDNPNNKPQVNHKDCTQYNNHVNNLEWCTQKENIQHARKNNLYPNDYKKTKVLVLNLDDEPILWFDSMRECAKELGLNEKYICKRCFEHSDFPLNGLKFKYYEEWLGNVNG
jgi:hypothetical protein